MHRTLSLVTLLTLIAAPVDAAIRDADLEVVRAETWVPESLGPATGSRAGWWGMGEGAESFLDELITWRELGFNMAWQRPDADQYETLPDWALTTLAQHRKDPRPHVYDRATFEDGLDFSTGIREVLVSGTLVVRGGELVDGVFPGQPVLGGAAAGR